jgi:hypothetical protein
MMNVNYPLVAVRNHGLMYFKISSKTLLDAISQMPEHTAIGVMRNALIDTFVAPPTQIRLDFQHFNSNYSIMHTMLMGDEAATYSSYYSFDRDDYKYTYLQYLDSLKKSTILYTVDLRDKNNNIVGGLNAFTSGLDLGLNEFTFSVTYHEGISMKITQNNGEIYGKYMIANRYNYFNSNTYLNNPSDYVGVIYTPEYKSKTIFEIKDTLKTN